MGSTPLGSAEEIAKHCGLAHQITQTSKLDQKRALSPGSFYIKIKDINL
jgi:hypothetical protein